MNDSMAQQGHVLAPLEMPGWKTALNWIAAILTSLIFITSGLWKVTDPLGWAARLAQARVPENLSLAATLVLGIAETVAAVLVLVPRFRKWGAWLGSALLVAFILYMGLNYNALHGAECNCFPWIKRVVGPGFFIGDAIMLLLAIVAGVWAGPVQSKRSAIMVVCAVTVFAMVSYGASAVKLRGVKAPSTITVDGKPFSTQQGRVFIYFFDPECSHCLDAGKRMAKLDWGDTKVVGVPTSQPRFAPDFLHDTGLRAGISNDLKLLKQTFPFGDPPAGVALENGRQIEPVTKFEDDEPANTLRRLGFVR
ncbi:MAG TPA: DoxX family protein [Bryobacteraceae bacterium]|nr:DoxX family protein [Bryobacteraceae bacterium]